MYKCKDCSADYYNKEEYEIYHRCKNSVSPNHYKAGGIETIDIIKSKLTREEYEGYIIGNILKYITRFRHKNGIEDVKKAEQYIKWLIESLGDEKN
jgi:hypothetical protein